MPGRTAAKLFTLAMFAVTVAAMKELLRSNDPVYLSYVAHLLDEAGIGHLLFDGYTSAIEGSIGAIPRRIMVADEDLDRARRALGNASLTIPG